MAQRPWEILRSKFISPEEANEFLAKSIQDTTRLMQHATIEVWDLETQRALQSETEGILTNKKKKKIYSERKNLFFKKYICRGLAQLFPSFLQHQELGVKSFLSGFLFKFVPEFGGVWVAFRKVRATDRKGFSYDEEALGIIVFNIDLEVLVFAPQPGSILIGEVSEIREEAIELLVLNCWKATIPKQLLPPGATIIIPKDFVKTELINEEEINEEVKSETHEPKAEPAQIAKQEPIDDAEARPSKRAKVDDAQPRVLIPNLSRPADPPQVIKMGAPVKFFVVGLQCASSDGQEYFAIQGSLRSSRHG